MKNLITGITGQDGLFLTNHLLKKGSNQEIYGVSRLKKLDKFYNDLGYINSDLNLNNLHISNVNLLNQKEINQYIKDIEPDYIFNLSGPSSVYNSYKNPEKTISNIKTIFDNLINACVEQNNFCNFFQASSSEMFKESNEVLDETSSFGPISPYAKAKYDVHIYLNDLRAKFDWNINSGIMFNHESEFRDDDYLFMKIINAAINIKHGKEKELIIGSLDIKRDWSYAKDVVEAISLITEEKNGDDYVIGSGKGHSIKELVDTIFSYFNLNFENYVIINEKLLRKGDPLKIISNPIKIKEDLGWGIQTSFEDLILKCINYKLSKME